MRRSIRGAPQHSPVRAIAARRKPEQRRRLRAISRVAAHAQPDARVDVRMTSGVVSRVTGNRSFRFNSVRTELMADDPPTRFALRRGKPDGPPTRLVLTARQARCPDGPMIR